MTKSKMPQSQQQDPSQAQDSGQAAFDPSGGMGNAAMQEEMAASDDKGPIVARLDSIKSTDTSLKDNSATTVAMYRRGRRHGVEQGSRVDVGPIRGAVTAVYPVLCEVTFWHHGWESVGSGSATIVNGKTWNKSAWRKFRQQKQDDDGAEWTPDSDPDKEHAGKLGSEDG